MEAVRLMVRAEVRQRASSLVTTSVLIAIVPLRPE